MSKNLLHTRNISAPRLKQPQKPLLQADGANTKGCDEAEQVPQGNASPLRKAEADSFQDDAGAPDETHQPHGRKSMAPAEVATGKTAAAGQRARHRAGSAKESANGPEAKKKPPSGQQAQLFGGRVSHGGVARSSPGAPPPRTGEEIWGLNMQLGKIVEQLADPEDCKPGRRKQKSPKLQEIAHKCWGGTYGDKLDKDFAAFDVEQPPAPKYEPPTFLLDEKVAEDQEMGGGADDILHRPHNDTAIARDKSADEPPRETTTSGRDSPGASDVTAGTAPARGREIGARGIKSAGAAAGRRAAAGAAKKPSTAPAAAAPQATLATVAEGAEKVQQGRAGADGEPDTVANACDGDQSNVEERRAETGAGPAARAGGRKAKPAVAARPAPKAGQARAAAARRTGRGPAAASAADVTTEDQGDAMDASPSDTAAAAVTAGPGNANRLRRSHVPTTAFGSTVSKPPAAAAPSAAAAAAVSEAMEDVAMSIGEGAAPVAAKRSREGAISVDDRLRQNKATRMEQSTAKEVENLKHRAGELQNKLNSYAEKEKKLRSDLAAAEKRAEGAEQERDREHKENERLTRDNEKLKAELNDRDDKLAKLNQDLKQLKSENVALKQRNIKVDGWGMELKQAIEEKFEKLKQLSSLS